MPTDCLYTASRTNSRRLSPDNTTHPIWSTNACLLSCLCQESQLKNVACQSNAVLVPTEETAHFQQNREPHIRSPISFANLADPTTACSRGIWFIGGTRTSMPSSGWIRQMSRNLGDNGLIEVHRGLTACWWRRLFSSNRGPPRAHPIWWGWYLCSRVVNPHCFSIANSPAGDWSSHGRHDHHDHHDRRRDRSDNSGRSGQAHRTYSI